jgi:hypothetical protein
MGVNTGIFCRSLVLVAGVLLPLAATAQDIAACHKITDDKARLDCFDRATQGVDTAPAAVAVPPAQPSAASPAAAAPPPAAKPSSSLFSPFESFGLSDPTPTRPEDFGRSSIPVTAPSPPRPPDEPAPITKITAKVVQILDPDRKPKFVLDNNQVWTALTYVRITPHSKGGNTVTIESSIIGYQMTLNDASFQFSVRRLQ